MPVNPQILSRATPSLIPPPADEASSSPRGSRSRGRRKNKDVLSNSLPLYASDDNLSDDDNEFSKSATNGKSKSKKRGVDQTQMDTANKYITNLQQQIYFLELELNMMKKNTTCPKCGGPASIASASTSPRSPRGASAVLKRGLPAAEAVMETDKGYNGYENGYDDNSSNNRVQEQQQQNKENEELKASIQTLRAQLDEERVNKIHAQKQLEEAKLSKTHVDDELKDIKKNFSKTQGDMGGILNNNLVEAQKSKRLQQQLNLIERLADERLSDWSVERKNMVLAAEELRTQLSDTQRQVALLTRRLHKEQKIARDQEVKILELSQKTTAHEAPLTSLSERSVQLEKENIKLNNEIKKMQMREAQAVASRHKADELVDELLDENTTYKHKVVEMSAQIRGHEENERIEQQSADKWSPKLVDLLRQNKKLKEQSKHLLTTHSRLEKSLKKTKEDQLSAEQLYYKSRQKVHELQKLLDDSMVREGVLEVVNKKLSDAGKNPTSLSTEF